MTQDDFYSQLLEKVDALLETVYLTKTTLTTEQLAEVEAKELEARSLQAEANKVAAELSLAITKSQLQNLTNTTQS